MTTYTAPPDRNSFILTSGDILDVNSGGTAIYTRVYTEALLTVSSGGIVVSTQLLVTPGNERGGFEFLLSGGVASDTLVLGASQEEVGPGATAIGTMLGNFQGPGGYQTVDGTAIDTVVSSGGIEYVSSGALAIGTSAYTGGTVFVSSGGTVSNAVLSRGGRLNVFGSAVDTVLSATSSAGVDYDGAMFIYSGGIATGTQVENGGQEYVSSGGIDSSGINDSGGYVVVFSGGITSSAVLSGGLESIDGSALDTTISSGGELDVSLYGVADGTTIDSGGLLYIGSGGVASGTVLHSGGSERIHSGGSDSGVAINGGFETVSAFGVLSSATVKSGTLAVYGVASKVSVEGGSETVYAGGSGVAGAVQGSETVSSGGIVIGTTISSGGVVTILAGGEANLPAIHGGTLTLAAGALVGAGGLDFTVAQGKQGGTLNLTGEGTGAAFASNFTAVVSGFTGGGGTAALSDVIDVSGTSDPGDHLVWTQTGASGTLQVETAGSTVLETLTLAGSYAQRGFDLVETAATDQITYNTAAACYRRGTLIGTARGQQAVETLAIGDAVRTASGALRPVKWIGRRSYAGRFVRGRVDILPIRIKAGAIDGVVPMRDLWVSPNHAMYFGGCQIAGLLIEARHLVNGRSILQDTSPQAIEYLHVELETHDVIYAEGALSETFIDDDSRARFHNAHEHALLHPDRPSQTITAYCAPRLDQGYEVEAVRQRLALWAHWAAQPLGGAMAS